MKYVLLFLFLIGIVGCNDDEHSPHGWGGDISPQLEVKDIQKKMFYFQDKSTGLCYAFYWGGTSYGGPAMTLVPRDKVEKFLVNP